MFHVSPSVGPRRCEADTPETCRFQASEHYGTKEQAQAAWDKEMSRQYGATSTRSRRQVMEGEPALASSEVLAHQASTEPGRRAMEQRVQEDLRRYEDMAEAIRAAAASGRCDMGVIASYARRLEGEVAGTRSMVEALEAS